MTEGEWIGLADAVRLIGAAASVPDQSARLLLCEWLGDGLLSAKADRIIEHRLIEAEPVQAPVDLAAVLALGEPLHAWELPTQAVIHDAQVLDPSFWTPAPPGIEHHELWSSGQITCADGNGTRARRVYVGVRVEQTKVYETAGLYGYNLSENSLAGDGAASKASGAALLSDRTGGIGSDGMQDCMPQDESRGRRPKLHGAPLANFLARVAREGAEFAATEKDEELGRWLQDEYKAALQPPPNLRNASRDARSALEAWRTAKP